MVSPTEQGFDMVRKEGLRPQVVGCISCGKKLLFVYDQKYKLWQLPQGGIDNKESLEEAFRREMTEELGQKFVENIGEELTVVGSDQIIFPQASQNTRELKTDAGESVFMQGKKYFFTSASSSSEELNIAETEFNDYRWVSYEEAHDLCETIYQKGKQRITQKAIELLKESDLL